MYAISYDEEMEFRRETVQHFVSMLKLSRKISVEEYYTCSLNFYKIWQLILHVKSIELIIFAGTLILSN